MKKELMIKALQMNRKKEVIEKDGEYYEKDGAGAGHDILLAPGNSRAFRLNERIEIGSRTCWAEITKETEKAMQITCYRQRRERITEVSDWYPKSQMLQIDENTWAIADWMRGKKNYYTPVLVELDQI